MFCHCGAPDVHGSSGRVKHCMLTVMSLVSVKTGARSRLSGLLWRNQLVLNTMMPGTIRISSLRALMGVDGSALLMQGPLRSLDA